MTAYIYKAYETEYNNVIFRSRLEAKWAAFFDLLKWQWEYEPFDLQGYIPDFVLKFYKPLLVEVKPAMSIESMDQYRKKIEGSGWTDEYLIVGASLFEEYPGSGVSIGLLMEPWEDPHDSFLEGRGLLFNCFNCNRHSIYHEIGSYSCRVGGCYDGDHYLGQFENKDIDAFWKEAGNIVQWHKK